MTNLSLFKPCVAWCVQAHLELAYSASWILFISILVSLIGYVLSKSDRLPEKYLFIPEYLLLLGVGLVAAFLLLNHYNASENAEKELDEQIVLYLDRLGDDARMIPLNESVDDEWKREDTGYSINIT